MASKEQPGRADRRRRPRAHVVVPTHTPRHLALCLASLGRQQRPPATVVVTVDGEVAEVEAEARRVWERLEPASRSPGSPPRLAITMRPHAGVAQLNQVRNNGLRALDSLGLDDEDLVIVLDGDTMLAPDAVERHLELTGRGKGGKRPEADLIVPFRVNLTEQRTAGVSLDDLVEGRLDLEGLASEADRESLRARDRRYRRQLALKRVPGLVKAHKPKVLGGHHAVRAGALRAVNGYDEGYTGYGFDDDDLARRLHQLRPRVRTVIAVEEILALHLWHPSRAPSRPEEAPGAARFARHDLPVSAEKGWRSPAGQEEGRVVVL